MYDNEIDALEKVWEDYQVAKDGHKWTSNGSSPDAAKQYKAQQDTAEKELKSLLTKHGYKNLEDAEEAIATLKANRKAAARYQEAGAIEKPVLEKVDIDIKGTYDSSYDNKDVDSRSLEKAYKYINGKDDSLESNLFLPVYDEDGSRLYTQPAVYYAWMDEKEKKVFNYLFNTGKKEEAQKYFSSDAERRTQIVPDVEIEQYDLMAYTHYLNTTDYYDWWLRSPGKTADFAAFVGRFGDVNVEGEILAAESISVRPAVWIDLNKVKEVGLEMTGEE